MKYFCQIKSDIFHLTDMLWRSKLLRTPIGPLLYQFQSKPNQNRGQNPIFPPPNFTKSEMTFFSFCSELQALSIFFIWLKSRRNPLIMSMNNSINWVFASGQVWFKTFPFSGELLKNVWYLSPNFQHQHTSYFNLLSKFCLVFCYKNIK